MYGRGGLAATFDGPELVDFDARNSSLQSLTTNSRGEQLPEWWALLAPHGGSGLHALNPGTVEHTSRAESDRPEHADHATMSTALDFRRASIQLWHCPTNMQPCVTFLLTA